MGIMISRYIQDSGTGKIRELEPFQVHLSIGNRHDGGAIDKGRIRKGQNII
jgi:hypothetical protein